MGATAVGVSREVELVALGGCARCRLEGAAKREPGGWRRQGAGRRSAAAPRGRPCVRWRLPGGSPCFCAGWTGPPGGRGGWETSGQRIVTPAGRMMRREEGGNVQEG